MAPGGAKSRRGRIASRGPNLALSGTSTCRALKRRHGRVFDLRGIVGRYAVVLALIAMIIGFSLLRPDMFSPGHSSRSSSWSRSWSFSPSVTIALAATSSTSRSRPSSASSGRAARASDIRRRWALGPARCRPFSAAGMVGVTNGIFVVGIGVGLVITTLGTGPLWGALPCHLRGRDHRRPAEGPRPRHPLRGPGHWGSLPVRTGTGGGGSGASWRHSGRAGPLLHGARKGGGASRRASGSTGSALVRWYPGAVRVAAAALLAGQTGAAQASYGQASCFPRSPPAFSAPPPSSRGAEQRLGHGGRGLTPGGRHHRPGSCWGPPTGWRTYSTALRWFSR